MVERPIWPEITIPLKREKVTKKCKLIILLIPLFVTSELFLLEAQTSHSTWSLLGDFYIVNLRRTVQCYVHLIFYKPVKFVVC